MHIVIAPDSFKGSISSRQAAEVMKDAVRNVNKDWQVTLKPMADGGEGTTESLLSATGGQQIPITCTGPLGKRIQTSYAIINDNTAVIECARIAGLVQVPVEDRNPEATTTYGLGEVMLDALERGCRNFLFGLGGSATNDGGLGMLKALGMEVWDQHGNTVNHFGRDVRKVDKVSFHHMDSRLSEISIKVACDVDNPLTGERGATRVFGPQKGASKELLPIMDEGLRRYGSLIESAIGKDIQPVPGAGAAGGLGFALMSIGASLVSGAKLIADAIRLEETIKRADVVLTGEGQSDEQTLYGKAPGYVAELGAAYSVPVVLISGGLQGNPDVLSERFAGCFSIVNRPLTLEECMADAEALLFQQTKQVVHLLNAITTKGWD